MHEIRVVITSDDNDLQKAEKAASVIEKEAKEVEGRILQKRSKDNAVRFTIMPTIKKAEPQTKGTVEEEKKFLEPDNINVQQVRSSHI